MSTERGTVQRIEDGWSWVLARRKGGCDRCGHKSHCQMIEGGDLMVVKAKNTAHAGIGDEVELYLDTKNKLKTMFIVYMVPVLGLLAGAISAKSLSGLLGLNENLGLVLFPLTGFILAFLLVRFFEARVKATGELTPVVSRIIRRSITSANNPQSQATGCACSVSSGGRP